MVLRFTALPPGYPTGYQLPPNANVAEYARRGWPVFETACAALAKGSNKCLDAARLPISDEWPCEYREVVRACTAGDARPAPLLPTPSTRTSTERLTATATVTLQRALPRKTSARPPLSW